MEDRFEQERMCKVEALRAKGVDPYGARFDGVTPVAQIVGAYEEGRVVRVAGS